MARAVAANRADVVRTLKSMVIMLTRLDLNKRVCKGEVHRKIYAGLSERR
jgi:hypothetical protein